MQSTKSHEFEWNTPFWWKIATIPEMYLELFSQLKDWYFNFFYFETKANVEILDIPHRKRISEQLHLYMISGIIVRMLTKLPIKGVYIFYMPIRITGLNFS